MLRFLGNDWDSYEDRCVDKTETDWGFMSTAAVPDGKQPYETGMGNEHYEDHPNEIMILEGYDTKEEAQEGHDKWLDVFNNCPPETFTEVINSEDFQSLELRVRTYKKEV